MVNTQTDEKGRRGWGVSTFEPRPEDRVSVPGPDGFSLDEDSPAALAATNEERQEV